MKFWLSFPIIKPRHKSNNTLVVLYKAVRNFDGESYYNRRNIAVSPVFVCGGRPRTAHIYNPSKPPFDKGGLWQGVALHCFAIWMVASKSRINRLEISMWCPTTTGETLLFLLFFRSGGDWCPKSYFAIHPNRICCCLICGNFVYLLYLTDIDKTHSSDTYA